MKLPLIWCVAAQLAMVGLANAQAKDPWIGRRVFTHYGTVLKVGGRVVDDEGRAVSLNASGKARQLTRVYRVEHTKGDWLWLRDEKSGISGWVKRRYVITYDHAVDFFTSQINAYPDSRLYNSRGNVWQEKGEYDIAIADFNEAIRLDPKNALAYNNRGVAWSGKKDFGKSTADFNEAIRLDPRIAVTYSNRGNDWNNQKSYEKAIADCNEAIRLDPRYAPAYNNRGNAWLRKKDYEKAIADYNEAIRLYPRYAPAYNNRGNAWLRKNDYERALADYDEAIRLGPEIEAPYNGRAWIWATCPIEKYRDAKKAVESATRACELSGWKKVNHLHTLAAAHAEAGDFGKAVEWQERANKLDTDGEYLKSGEERLKSYRDKKPYRRVE